MTIHDLRKTLWKHKVNGHLYRVVAMVRKEVVELETADGDKWFGWETWVVYAHTDDFACDETYQRTLGRFLSRFDRHDKFPERKRDHNQEVSEGIPT